MKKEKNFTKIKKSLTNFFNYVYIIILLLGFEEGDY